MRDPDLERTRSAAPMLILLAAGLAAGGAWEVAVHLDGRPSSIAVVEVDLDVDAPVKPGSPEAEPILIPPPPVPPPVVEEQDLSAAPTFTPFTTAPRILNRPEVARAMEGAYPPLLRDAGVSGTVRIYFFIDAEGTLVKTVVDRSSGHAALDEAALSVAEIFRFSPALMRGDPVPVWISFPITFQVR